MDGLAHDERVRHLQRLAYGAATSDAEREAAVAELEAMRRRHDSGAADAARDVGATLPPAGIASDGAQRVLPVDSLPDPPRARGVARPLVWAIAVGTLALIVGVATGWQFGTRASSTSSPVAAESGLPGDAARATVPLTETDVLRFFDREPNAADIPEFPIGVDGVEPTDHRLLVTRSDGVSLYAARVDGGEDVCVVVAVPGAGSGGACTADGEFPEAGLWTESSFEGGAGVIRGTIHPDGTVELTPQSYSPGANPVVRG